jgi:hypothetical protein
MANQQMVDAVKQQDPPSPLIPATITPESVLITHEGKLIVAATACPKDISYPTDLNLLNDSREKAEELIDFLFNPKLHEKQLKRKRKLAAKYAMLCESNFAI